MGHSPVSERDQCYESGYGSASSSESSIPDVYFTKPHLEFINKQLQQFEPQDILRWCIITLPSLYQETAFGLTGLCTIDMLSKINAPKASAVDLIFFDTLHHFSETLDLVDRVQLQYPELRIHTFQPAGVTSVEEFAIKHGSRLWESDEVLYDWVAKVEPAERAYRDLRVGAVLTGRRRSQGGQRGSLPIVEVDEAGLIKINPFANWSFQQVEEYIRANKVPYNTLLDRGYKSVGDWHSTKPVKAGEDERSGRWQGQEKTECGIHNPRSQYARMLQLQAQPSQQPLATEVTIQS